LVRPVIEHEVVTLTQVWPVFDVTVYPVISDPPSETGALQVIIEPVFTPEVARTPVGASGLVIAMKI
jgi:hypothetical protein